MRFRVGRLAIILLITGALGQLPSAGVNQPLRDVSHTTIENPHGLIQDNRDQMVAITAARALGIPVEALYGAALSNRAAGQLAIGTAEQDPCVQHLQGLGYSLQDAARECERHRKPTLSPAATPFSTPAVAANDIILRESLLPPPNIVGLAWLFAPSPRNRVNVETTVDQLKSFFGSSLNLSVFGGSANNGSNNSPSLVVGSASYLVSDGSGNSVSPTDNHVIFLSEIYSILNFTHRINQTPNPAPTGTPTGGLSSVVNPVFDQRRTVFRLLFGDAYMFEFPTSHPMGSNPSTNTNRTVQSFVLPQILVFNNHSIFASSITSLDNNQRDLITRCSYRERIRSYTRAILTALFDVARHTCQQMNNANTRSVTLLDQEFNQTSIFSRLAREQNILETALIDLRTQRYLGNLVGECYPDVTDSGLSVILGRNLPIPAGTGGSSGQLVIRNLANMVEFLKYPMERGVINVEKLLELTRIILQLLPIGTTSNPATPTPTAAGNQSFGRDCGLLDNRLNELINLINQLPHGRLIEHLDMVVNTYMANLADVHSSGNRIGIRFIQHNIDHFGAINHGELLALLISYLSAKLKVQNYTVKVMNSFYNDLLAARPFLNSPPPKMSSQDSNTPRTMFDLLSERFEYLVSVATGDDVKFRDSSKINTNLQSLEVIAKSIPLILSAL